MGIFDSILGRKKSPAPPEHAVLVAFAYGQADLEPLFALERQLEVIARTAQVGEYDGHEIAVDLSDGRLYLYGPDAERLFAAVKPALQACGFMRGATVRLRFGPPADGVPERSKLL